MPAMSKTTLDVEQPVALPTKHVAILFEGAWLFRPDPADPSRVQAVCPYVDAPDHVCVYGFWPSSLPAAIQEANAYRVDMEPKQESGLTYSEVFEAAAAKYGIIYVRKTDPDDKISAVPPEGARLISVPLPNQIRAAGKLSGATIRLGNAADKYELGIDGNPVSLYVTLIFIYEYDGDKPVLNLSCSTGAEVTPLGPPPADFETHLVIRVHAVRLPPSSLAQPVGEVEAEDEHFTETFNLLRGLIRIGPSGFAQSQAIRPDFSLEPPTDKLVFIKGDTNLTLQELGLPDGTVQPDSGDLAACAGGVEAIGTP